MYKSQPKNKKLKVSREPKPGIQQATGPASVSSLKAEAKHSTKKAEVAVPISVPKKAKLICPRQVHHQALGEVPFQVHHFCDP
ncbi:hypothetical protein DSO57_1035514 [Entomophthora muscae]|uniref:Uncharacterized protein n=1 Tax=Entomophthora muscae TaxID=34485 RepID=A0ACC2SP60_9FUNG|nr:hypothetical protein DSO57_1035514 [Entomophthora muscae]